MGFYRRRPVPPIEARRFWGGAEAELAAWVPGGRLALVAPNCFELKFRGAAGFDLTAVKGDWVVQDPDGGFRPVKDAAFQAAYEEASPRVVETPMRKLRGIAAARAAGRGAI